MPRSSGIAPVRPALLLALVAAIGIFLLWRGWDERGGEPRAVTEQPLSGGGVLPEGGPGGDSAAGIDGAAEDRNPADQSAPPAVSLRPALDGEGIRLFNAVTGSSRALTFGSEAAVVRSALVSVWGREPVEEGYSADCAATFIRWRDGLTIWVVRDSFVGWSLGDDGARLTTPTGVGIGSTRADLEDSYDATVVRSSIGVEFTAGGLAGVLESSDPGARITNLWGGQTCIAR